MSNLSNSFLPMEIQSGHHSEKLYQLSSMYPQHLKVFSEEMHCLSITVLLYTLETSTAVFGEKVLYGSEG